MEKSIIEHKMVLGMHSQMDHLLKMEKNILSVYPKIIFYKATDYEEGLQLLLSLTFDLVILKIGVEKEKSLMELALRRNFPVILLSENGQYREGLEQITGLDPRAHVQKADARKIVPVIEDVLKMNNVLKWRSFLANVSRTLNSVVSALSTKDIDDRYTDDSDKCIYY